MNKISRRTFLKLSGAAATATAAGAVLPKFVTSVAKAEEPKNAEYVNSICEMCTSRCPITATVVDGKVVSVEGNKGWSSTGGTLCARGVAGQSLLYDEQRLKNPLIRTGERGEGQWKEVSWEEAYDYIVDKMQEIKTKYGPEAMAFASRSGLHTTHFFNLAKAYGSPNVFLHDSTCPLSRDVAMVVTFGTKDMNIDYSNVKYFLSLGRNYFEGINVSHARNVMNALNKGAKLVYVDPRFSATAAKADEWYPIKPGTDLALVLAIQHVLIRDNLYDKEFVEKYTVGFDKVQEAVKDYTPEWAEKETGIPAADIERIAQEMAEAKPKAIIDWGWRTCTSPEEFELRRASLITNCLLGAFETEGGLYLKKSAKYINEIAGKDVALKLKSPKIPDYPKMAERVDGAGVKGNINQFVPTGSGVVHRLPEYILTEKPYPIKGWFIYRNNPIITQPNTEELIQALKKLDLVVVCDVYLSDTAHYADVVLPESTFLERTEHINDASGSNPVYTLRQKVIEPLYNTKANWEIFKELGERLGLGDYFPWKDIDEYIAIQLDHDQELIDKIKKDGFLSAGLKGLFLRSKSSVSKFINQFPELEGLVNEDGIIEEPLFNLKTPSKKIELYSAAVEETFPGRGVPVYRPVKLKEENEFYFVQGKIAVMTNGASHNVPWLNELMPENSLWINPETAEKLGLKNGDRVEIKSSVGTQEGKVFVTEGIRTDTVFTYFGFGRLSPQLERAYKKGINTGMLLPTVTAEVGPINVHTTGVTLRKL